MDKILERLAERFRPAALADFAADFLPNVITAVLVFAIFFLIWFGLSKAFDAVSSRANFDKTAATFVRTAIKYIVLTIGLMTSLAELGVDVAAIVASLGVVGLSIGFAARDTLSNLISGIFIFWDRPFVVGDLIELGDVYGRVHDITLRSTRVVTVDGKMLAIPNTTVVNSIVASYTNFPHLRIEVNATVGVDEDLDRVRDVFRELVAGDPKVLEDPAPTMVVRNLNDYNVEVEFRIWIKDEKEHIKTRFALREELFEALREADVHMPYETLEINPLEVETVVRGEPELRVGQ